MSRPVQDIKIFGIQDRRANASRPRPWIVRRAIDGQHKSTSFSTKGEADRYRTLLMNARMNGEAFDHETGEPVSWQPIAADMPVHRWVRRWLAEQWPEWQPRTRVAAVEALIRFVPLAVKDTASAPPPGRSGIVSVTTICSKFAEARFA